MSSRKCFVVAQAWTPWRIAMANDFNPTTVFQLFDNLRADRHTPDIFDVATGDRLLVSNDGQRFHGGTRILRGFSGVEPIQVRLHIRASLEPPTRGQFTQLDATPTPLRRKLRQPPANVFSRHFVVE